MEFIFFCFCIQSCFLESLQYLFDVALVLCDIIRVDQDVIQVDYHAHIQEVGEHVIHKALEGSWSIS